jgi:hypothetical protein
LSFVLAKSDLFLPMFPEQFTGGRNPHRRQEREDFGIIS